MQHEWEKVHYRRRTQNQPITARLYQEPLWVHTVCPRQLTKKKYQEKEHWFKTKSRAIITVIHLWFMFEKLPVTWRQQRFEQTLLIESFNAVYAKCNLLFALIKLLTICTTISTITINQSVWHTAVRHNIISIIPCVVRKIFIRWLLPWTCNMTRKIRIVILHNPCLY